MEQELLVKISSQIGGLAADMDTVKKAVLGNGQAGLIQRVEGLEQNQKFVGGGIAVLGFLGTVLWGFLEWIFHFKKGG